MSNARPSRSLAFAISAALVGACGWLGCSSDPEPRPGSGGTGGSGAGASGSPGSGGTAGKGSAGTSGTAGAPRGGASGAGGTGGTAGGALGGAAGAAGANGGTGGDTNGGDAGSGGGAGKGGEAGQGGNAAGGAAGSAGAGGGAGTGGAGGGAQFDPPFILGADISSVQESQSTFRDTDGETKTIFAILKNHGFNYIRLKTFVDPSAPYGYASTANGCTGFPEPFGDRDHVVAFGKQAKDAGMGFLLNFHYSDVWADPGNQIIPEAWRDATTLADLASRVKAYTKDVLMTAVAAGARPDMVQVGNEITPGMLAHVPGTNTDCWGNNPAPAPAAISGSISNWTNFTTLLKAGIEAVREVDPRIQVMLHIENTDDLNGVRSWLDNVLMRDVEFDVLGLSCYVAFQGQPSVWQTTFSSLATNYPDLKFAIAEYNPERTQANLMMKNLPDDRGLGTFFWEPTRSGEWGNSLFTWQNNVATANSADFEEYDDMRAELGL
jgi:arabinogalactan endo-1,4-beta-galactosidase